MRCVLARCALMHISRFRLAARGGLGLSLSAEQCRERAVKLGRNFDGALDEAPNTGGSK